MISLLIWVLALLLVFGVIAYVIQLLPLPPPFATIAMAILALVFVLILIGMLLPLPPPVWHPSLR